MGHSVGQRRRRTVLALLVVGVVAFIAALAWLALDRSEPTPWTKPAEVDGDLVHLTYTGSACQDDASVEVEESEERVVLTIRATVRATSCPDLGVIYEIDARLERPLGERELVDGACRMEEIAHYADCSPKKTTR